MVQEDFIFLGLPRTFPDLVPVAVSSFHRRSFSCGMRRGEKLGEEVEGLDVCLCAVEMILWVVVAGGDG